MRKLIGVIIVFLMFMPLFAQQQPSNPTGQPYEWYLREMPITTVKNGRTVTRTEYCLRFSNEKADQAEVELFQSGVMLGICAYMYLDEEDKPFEAPCDWYVDIMDSRYSIFQSYPLFDDEVWPYVPQSIKLVLRAFKHTNRHIYLIYLSPYTGAMSVYFNPKFDENKGFYEIKLQQIKVKFRNIIWEEEIPVPCLESKFNPQSKTNI